MYSHSSAVRFAAVILVVLACSSWSAAAQDCSKPCYVVKDYWPIKTCKSECDERICNRGWGAWQSLDICCSPGVAFPEGCGKRPTSCWVVESYQLRTCIKDDRKCLQGYGVWESESGCCAPGAAFPEGCRTNLTRAAQPCWVVDTFFPARLCRQSDTLCSSDSGVQSWSTKEACCTPNAAFSEGCSAAAPTTPCWVVDSYWPVRKCRQETDIAACSRGWGVYNTKDICCAPNVAFPEGCSADSEVAAAAASGATATGPTPVSKLAAAANTLTAPTATNGQPAAAAKPAPTLTTSLPAVHSSIGP